MTTVKGRVLRRVLNHITDLISGGLALDNYTIGLAREDDTLVARDDIGGFHYFMGSMAVESLIVDLTYAKEPVATYALLPAGDDDGSMRVVLSENTLYIKSNGGWFKSDIVAWNDILDKPLTFPPSPHQHEIADVSGLSDALSLLIPKDQIGVPNGVAELDETGKVLSSQLPSFVDDVLEFANLASFPSTGESGKIYVALDTNKTYRWSGTAYIEISSSLALGETSSTAYRGDRGKTAYDHSQATGNPHGTTIGDISGLQTSLSSKLFGVITANRIPQGDSTTNKLKDSSWETYFDDIQPVTDNASNLGNLVKRVKTVFAYTINAATEIFEGGVSLASKYAAIAHTQAISTITGLSSALDGLSSAIAEKEPLHTRTDIDSSTDWNTLVTPGTYRQTGGTIGTNGPTGAYGYGILEVLARNLTSTVRCVQIYTPYRNAGPSNGGMWIRSTYDGTWVGWQHFDDRTLNDARYALIDGDPTFNSVAANTVTSNGNLVCTNALQIGAKNTVASATTVTVTGKSFIALTGTTDTILNGGTEGFTYYIASGDGSGRNVTINCIGGGTKQFCCAYCIVTQVLSRGSGLFDLVS